MDRHDAKGSLQIEFGHEGSIVYFADASGSMHCPLKHSAGSTDLNQKVVDALPPGGRGHPPSAILLKNNGPHQST